MFPYVSSWNLTSSPGSSCFMFVSSCVVLPVSSIIFCCDSLAHIDRTDCFLIVVSVSPKMLQILTRLTLFSFSFDIKCLIMGSNCPCEPIALSLCVSYAVVVCPPVWIPCSDRTRVGSFGRLCNRSVSILSNKLVQTNTM